MSRFGIHVRAVLIPSAALVLVGCDPMGGASESAVDNDPAATRPAIDGLSREQIEARAEAMSPAQAESLGIVDRTIHVEQLAPQDTVRFTPPDASRVGEPP